MASGKASARATIALLTGLVILGTSAILVRMAEAPGPVSGFYRMAIASIVLTGMLAIRRRHLCFNRRGIELSVLAGVLIGLDMVFWTTGVMLTGPTTPTLLANTTPVWVGLAAIVLYKEKHPSLFWIGLLTALSGSVMVVGGDVFMEGGLNLGALLGLVSAVFYSGFFLVLQRARQHTDALTALWITTVSSGIVLFVSALIMGHHLTGFGGKTILMFILMGVVIQVAGWILVTYSQGHLPASVVSPTLLGQPVLTAIFALPLLGERLGWVDLVGGMIVLGGVLLIHLSKQKKTGKVETAQ